MAVPTKSVQGNIYTELQSISCNKKNQDKLSNKMDVSAKTETEDISIDVISKSNISKKSGLDEKENEATGNDDKTITDKIASEDLLEKRSHKIGEGCSLFPIHMWLYFLYIFLSIVLAVFGTLLLLCGSWTNTGKFSFESIINVPFPKVEVEDHDYHAMALEFLQLTCWISGFFFWLFALYFVYVYHNLLWVSRPWDRQTWNRVRVAADQVLVQDKVREETVQDQFDRMNQKQQEEMKKYKRTLTEPAKKLGV